MYSIRNSGSGVKDQDFDLKFKLLILGNAMAGKTCFLVRYADGIFRVATRIIVTADLTYKTILRNDKKIKLEMWDTGKALCVAFIVKTALKELSSQLYVFLIILWLLILSHIIHLILTKIIQLTLRWKR